MNLVFSIGSYNPAHGGPFFSVGSLATHLGKSGETVRVLTADYPHLPVQQAPDQAEIKAVSAKLLPLIRQSWIPRCAKWLDRHMEEFGPDILHDNGLWLTLNHQVARVAERHGVPFILSPRGCLDPWAMQYRNWKKRIALALYQRKDLEAVDCFHAASDLEAESIRRMGFGQPIAVIPNGIELGGSSLETSSEEEPYALFLGRLHPIKNLPTLLKAWAAVQPEGWKLKLAGSDEVEHGQELRKEAEVLGIAEQVEFLGPVYGEAKWQLIRGASLAFLISHSENFGISAAEALGCGVPVIASKSTPWSCLEEEEMGWWVEGDPAGVEGALNEFTRCSPQKRQAMGQRASAYAEKTFGWPAIAQQFVEVYQWVKGEGAQPACIRS